MVAKYVTDRGGIEDNLEVPGLMGYYRQSKKKSVSLLNCQARNLWKEEIFQWTLPRIKEKLIVSLCTYFKNRILAIAIKLVF